MQRQQQLRRLSQALVVFVGCVLQSSPSSAQPVTGAPGMAELVNAFIEVVTVEGDGGKLEDVVKAARVALGQALGVMAAQDFVRATAKTLAQVDEKVCRSFFFLST